MLRDFSGIVKPLELNALLLTYRGSRSIIISQRSRELRAKRFLEALRVSQTEVERAHLFAVAGLCFGERNPDMPLGTNERDLFRFIFDHSKMTAADQGALRRAVQRKGDDKLGVECLPLFRKD